jgi:DNA-binding transcriptional ArsR family regulator
MPRLRQRWHLRDADSRLYLTIMLSVAPERMSQDLDLLFGALADATRRSIVERLAVGEATVTELAAPFSISLPAISRHLKVLERASLITRSQQGRWRSARLSPASLASAARWLVQSERRWAESFGRLDEHLARLTSEQQATPPPPRKTAKRQKKRGTR